MTVQNLIKDLRESLAHAWSKERGARTVVVGMVGLVVMILLPYAFASGAGVVADPPLTRAVCANAASHAALAGDRDWGIRCVRAIDGYAAASASPSASPTGAPGPTSAPSPTPTPSASPSPTAPGTPPFPDASTTGVPAGTTLRTGVPPGVVAVSATYWRINTAGFVLDRWDVPGQVEVNAANVRITNSRVRCGADQCINAFPNGVGLFVSHVDVDPGPGRSISANAINTADGATVDAVHINLRGTGSDGVKLQDRVTVRASLIEGLAMCSGAHSDGLQVDGGSDPTSAQDVLIEGNAIHAGNTSGLIVQGGLSPRMVIRGNLFVASNAGSACQSVSSFAVGYDAGSCPGGGCRFEGNTLSRGWESGPSYVPTIWTDTNGPNPWVANVYLDGSPVAIPG